MTDAKSPDYEAGYEDGFADGMGDAAPGLLEAAKAALAAVEGYARTHGAGKAAKKRIEGRAGALRTAIAEAERKAAE